MRKCKTSFDMLSMERFIHNNIEDPAHMDKVLDIFRLNIVHNVVGFTEVPKAAPVIAVVGTDEEIIQREMVCVLMMKV